MDNYKTVNLVVKLIENDLKKSDKNLNIKYDSVERMNTEGLENFPELIVEKLEKQGYEVVWYEEWFTIIQE